jgi:hypothetical protein
MSANRRSVLFVRIRAARALQCVESLRRSDPAEEFENRQLGPTMSQHRNLQFVPSWFLADQEQSGAFGTGSWTDTSPLNGCCTATFGCRIGTIKKSASYEFSGGPQRRASARR